MIKSKTEFISAWLNATNKKFMLTKKNMNMNVFNAKLLTKN